MKLADRVYQVGDRRYTRNHGYHWQDDPHSTLCFEVIEIITDTGNVSDDGGESWQSITQSSIKVRFLDCGPGRQNEEKTYSLDAELLQKSWSIAEACAAQKKTCQEKKYPHFAPSNGRCYSCSKNIYTRSNGQGFITGCPHCAKSYCS